MNTIHAVAACIFNTHNEVLLEYRQGDAIQELSNTYVLPGGKIELNETVYEAVERELKEETGQNARVMYPVNEHKPYVFVRRLIAGGYLKVILYALRCDLQNFDIEEISKKNHKLKWIPFNELKWYSIVGESYETIEECLYIEKHNFEQLKQSFFGM